MHLQCLYAATGCLERTRRMRHRRLRPYICGFITPIWGADKSAQPSMLARCSNKGTSRIKSAGRETMVRLRSVWTPGCCWKGCNQGALKRNRLEREERLCTTSLAHIAELCLLDCGVQSALTSWVGPGDVGTEKVRDMTVIIRPTRP